MVTHDNKNKVLFIFQMLDQLWISLTRLFDYIISILLTLPRDLRGLYKLIRHSVIIKYRVYRQHDFIAVFRENVKQYKTKNCFIFEETSLTFQQV